MKRTIVLFLLLVVLAVTAGFLVAYSPLDGIFYDFFGNSLVAVGGLYWLISIILFFRRSNYSWLFFISGLLVLIAGIILSVSFYGYTDGVAEMTI